MKKALKKALFIDRDGTLIVEPPVDMQVDSLAKLEFVPGAISAGTRFRAGDGHQSGRTGNRLLS